MHLSHLNKLVRLQELGFELVDPEQSGYIGGMAYFLSNTYGESWWEENNGLTTAVVRNAISKELDQYPDNYLKVELEDLDAVIADRLRHTP